MQLEAFSTQTNLIDWREMPKWLGVNIIYDIQRIDNSKYENWFPE